MVVQGKEKENQVDSILQYTYQGFPVVLHKSSGDNNIETVEPFRDCVM